MNSKILIVHVVLIVVLNIQSGGVSNQVDAAPKHTPQVASWFESLEKIDFQNIQATPTTTDDTVLKRYPHKKLRKKKIIKRKKIKERADADKQEIKKRKKHKKKDERRFVKTTVRERDREYNSSSSVENGDRRKPVDIIVHIKMHD